MSGDNYEGESASKEDSSDDRLGDDQGIVRSSSIKEDNPKRLRKKYGISDDIVMRVPLPEQRPWSAPPGWCACTACISLESRLWFPIPRLLISYARRRDVAISQMSPAAI